MKLAAGLSAILLAIGLGGGGFFAGKDKNEGTEIKGNVDPIVTYELDEGLQLGMSWEEVLQLWGEQPTIFERKMDG
ncbi:hypothetical protein D1B31_16570 [Neobacillus notoginsengisoli]|uniref:Uncharacterized protein n=2 Tax=Neobacillus notoginsengisoli TaxID=1578198 RepID=A0A417YRS3_9BACI|nr:hypothetical protein D1B31_16570 [Neobacillus notoginsengisoli]